MSQKYQMTKLAITGGNTLFESLFWCSSRTEIELEFQNLSSLVADRSASCATTTSQQFESLGSSCCGTVVVVQWLWFSCCGSVVVVQLLWYSWQSVCFQNQKSITLRLFYLQSSVPRKEAGQSRFQKIVYSSIILHLTCSQTVLRSTG